MSVTSPLWSTMIFHAGSAIASISGGIVDRLAGERRTLAGGLAGGGGALGCGLFRGARLLPHRLAGVAGEPPDRIAAVRKVVDHGTEATGATLERP